MDLGRSAHLQGTNAVGGGTRPGEHARRHGHGAENARVGLEKRQHGLHDGLRRSVAILRPDRHHPADHFLEVVRHVRDELVQERRLLCHAFQNVLGNVGFGREGSWSGQAPEQRASQPVYVCAYPPCLHRALLGSHEIHGAQKGSGIGHVRVDPPRQSEIQQLRLFLGGDDDVRRLDVTVDKLELVDLAQGAGDLVARGCRPC